MGLSNSHSEIVASENVQLTLRNSSRRMFSFRMKYVSRIVAIIAVLNSIANAASRPHVVSLGRWTSISIRSEERETQPTVIKIRALYVDGRAKEFTFGGAHDVTERTFVIQRIYRMNDSLPQEAGSTQWQWQRWDGC
jgi:hypothetical protein